MANSCLPRSQLLIGAALLLSLLTPGCKSGGPAAQAGAPPPLPVKVQQIKPEIVEDSSEFVGTLEAQRRVILQPETQGRIVEVYVGSGARIGRGQPVAKLRPDGPQAELEGAIANANTIVAAINTAKADIQVALAEQANAAADVELQQVQFKRTKMLVTEGALAEQELDIAVKNLKAAKATLQARKEQVKAAITNLDQQQFALKQAQAQAKVANTDFQFTLVRSPIAGVVGDFPVKLGDYVGVGQTITTITQNDSLDLRISVPTRRSDRLRLGLPVQLLDETGKRPIVNGRINFISPQVDTEAQAILTKVRFPNLTGRLRDGQFVRTKILWQRGRGILIPTAAVSRIGGQSFVFVAGAGDGNETGQAPAVARQTPVTLGPIQGESYQVIEGLSSGDRVIVSNILKLRDGAPIQPE